MCLPSLKRAHTWVRPYKGQPQGVAPTILVSLFSVFCLLFSVFCPLSSETHASDISVSARVDKSKLSIDDTLTLTIVIEGETRSLPSPELPVMSGFRTYSSSRSQNISIVNGEIFASTTFRYILVPQQIGKLTIEPIQIGYKGKIYETDPIEIEVTSASTAPPPARSPSAGTARRAAPASEPPSTGEESGGNKKLFIQTYVDKLRPYVNEQVTLTFAFYRSIDLFENPEYEPPTTVGFWSEDMPPQNQYFKTINGRTYQATEIKTALFPTTTGDLTISPARLKVAVPQQSEDVFSMDPFGIFKSGPWASVGKGKIVVLATQPIVIQGQPLPDEGKPEGFKGDVGEYRLSVKVDRTQVEANQPVTITTEVSGKGNIKTITSPVITLPQGFKEYEGGGSEDISKDHYTVQGKKVFEKVVIPTIPGKLEIPPVQYTFFNPSEKKYEILESEPILLEVKPSAKQEELVGVSSSGGAGPRAEVRRVGEDIRFIKTTVLRLEDQEALPWDQPSFGWIYSSPWFLLGLLYTWQRRQSRLSQDVVYAREQKAHGAAQKRLRQAKAKMNAGDTAGFYTEAQKAIGSFISDRLGIATASLTMDEVIRELRNRAVSEDLLKRLRVLLEECDLARFAPSQFDPQQMKIRFEEAASLIMQLEKARRKKSFGFMALAAFLMIFVSTTPCWPAAVNELFDQANADYQNQKFDSAVEEYRQLLQQGIRHGAVYYNLGNAYWKKGERGNAILYYERALRLLPRDEDVRANLSYAKGEIVAEGKIRTEAKGVLEKIAEVFTGKIALRELVTVTVVFYWILIGFLLLWVALVAQRRALKPWLTALFTLWILLAGLTGLKEYDLARAAAVILQKEAVLRAGPGDDFQAQATLPEGLVVRIVRQSKGWIEVRLGDLQGWVVQEAVERI